MSLATIKVDNVTTDKFAALLKSMQVDFKNHFTKTSDDAGNYAGTLIDHGSTVDYIYDVKSSVLTFDVEALHHGFLTGKTSVDQVKQDVVGWVETTVANMPEPPTVVGKTIPKSASVISMPASVATAPPVPVNPVEPPVLTVVQRPKVNV